MLFKRTNPSLFSLTLNCHPFSHHTPACRRSPSSSSAIWSMLPLHQGHYQLFGKAYYMASWLWTGNWWLFHSLSYTVLKWCGGGIFVCFSFIQQHGSCFGGYFALTMNCSAIWETANHCNSGWSRAHPWRQNIWTISWIVADAVTWTWGHDHGVSMCIITLFRVDRRPQNH